MILTSGSILSPLIVPPVNLAVVAALGLAMRRRRAGRWVAGLALAALLLLAVPLVSGALLRGLEDGLPMSGLHTGSPPPGAIVVLGAEVATGGETDGVERDDPGPLTLERLRVGADLARRTGLPLLVTGGMVADGADPVATVMAASLKRDFGVTARWVEPVSATTWENARDSAKLLAADGVGSVLLVTHAWHMRRALIAFRAAGLPATPAPVRLDRLPNWGPDMLLPQATSWTRSFYALHEWIGCLWYAARAYAANG